MSYDGYERHKAQDGTDGFKNGETLTATDMNNIEIALCEHDDMLSTNGADISDLKTTVASIAVLTQQDIEDIISDVEAAIESESGT